MNEKLLHLDRQLSGNLYHNSLLRSIYATDASVYRVLPLAVAYPKNKEDLKLLLEFARKNDTSLILRTAGTSLAGQCVGEGIVVDVSKYFTKIEGFDAKAQTVTIEPGVIRDELNEYLRPHHVFFGPNTSTSNRCMIGGMVGNNSSGTTSIKYGVTRDKIVELETILTDGSEVVFKPLTAEEFMQKTTLPTFEGNIYKVLYNQLSSCEIKEEVFKQFPKPSIHRRNTGYAIDSLLNSEVFDDSTRQINVCELLAGSEGTLAITTKITLKVDPLPPSNAVLIAAHFDSVQDCCDAVFPLMKHDLYTCEMMDKTILDCTKGQLMYEQHRFFLKNDPKAILMLELRANTKDELSDQISAIVTSLEKNTKSYHYPILSGHEINLALELRKAGLGLLGNMIGDQKAVACIEDTAVDLEDLSTYIKEFSAIMKSFGQQAVYYAHAGAGELHLRPILNLKKSEDVILFKKITTAVAQLVKKYGGAMSGEHGDGRVRGWLIPFLVGDQIYDVFKAIKQAFDPKNILNPGKIVDVKGITEELRYQKDRIEPVIETLLDFSEDEGFLRSVEKCNGSGDCRKGVHAGGIMCPSYRVTKNEKDTTRARANALREFLTTSQKTNPFDHKGLKEVLDLCISCKGCKSECPSTVDMAAMKAEFDFQYQETNGYSLRAKAFAYNTRLNRFASQLPVVSNFVFKNKYMSSFAKKIVGIAAKRSLPLPHRLSLKNYIKTKKIALTPNLNPIKTVVLFVDEFTNYLDVTIGLDAIELLTKLNYNIEVIDHHESGRTFISKGFLKEAKQIANRNIQQLASVVTSDKIIVGIEPSAILTLRDEYLRLADDLASAKALSDHTFLIDEFLAQEIETGHIRASQFSSARKEIKLHGHCHQKVLSKLSATFTYLNLPQNFSVTIINSGCCGMAGSFGYEKEHYEISMKMGELSLFPAIRKSKNDVLIAATGTSCRHQIKDGTSRIARHPISILKEALV
ncbi:FAD-binding and (Fe-S)-binding domain-containing protein [Gangjinia marincola]|uniref:FAD-binding and (Fe-S)-binding domain-containing protein n=1 Tax=Gangjinia marincola TaxID=578463 RepID=A0ABN1MD21_9FLAO